MLYDVFICHASADKADFVRPLVEAIRDQHIEVWYGIYRAAVHSPKCCSQPSHKGSNGIQLLNAMSVIGYGKQPRC